MTLTYQGELTVQEPIKARPGEQEGIYILLAHPECQTRRVFRNTATLREVEDGTRDGFYIWVPCAKCGQTVELQVFRAREMSLGFSFLPPQGIKDAPHVQDGARMEEI